jgi:trigger factor
MKFDLKNLPQSEIEILVELDPKEWGGFVDEAVKDLTRDTKVEGFRPGHVPKHILEQRIGQGKILEKAADLAVKKTYIELITDNKIEAIGRPEIQVTKLAEGNPFEFKVKVAVMPKIKMPDWREIVKSAKPKKRTEFEAEEKEVKDAISWLQKSRTKYATVNREAKMGDRVEVDFTAKKDGQIIEGGISKNHPLILGEGHFVPGFEDNLLSMKENEEKKFSLVFPKEYQNKELAGQAMDFETKMNLVQESQVPELNDEFAKSVGSFDNFEALKKNISEGIAEEKQLKAKDAWRMEILQEIIKKSEVELPKILVDLELEKMIHELKDNIAQMGLDFEAYLNNIKKTEEELKKEWLAKARERVCAALVLQDIAETEKIEVLQSEIENDINRFLHQYPDVETVRAQIDMEQLKEYTRGRLRNEKVFELMESL